MVVAELMELLGKMPPDAMVLTGEREWALDGVYEVDLITVSKAEPSPINWIADYNGKQKAVLLSTEYKHL